MASSSFLSATLGDKGARALTKACKTIDGLDTLMFPKVVLAWLNMLQAKGYSGAIPGTKSELSFHKSEENKEEKFDGEIKWDGKIYHYKNADLYQIAAAVALAVGAKSKEVQTDLPLKELEALGKSVEVLVKAHVANLSKKDLPGLPAQPKEQALQETPALPATQKIGNASVSKPKKPKSILPMPKLPGLKIDKSELSLKCTTCKQFRFTPDRFVGCACLGRLAKGIESHVRPDGIILEFSDSFDLEDVATLKKFLKGK